MNDEPTIVALVWTPLGALLGLIIAGAVFGAIATLYDIRDSLRLMVQANGDGAISDVAPESHPVNRPRREPYIGGEATRAPI
jgi:hypothetical protein